jgi:thiamine-phosphate pyrophosphorylase
MAAERMRLHGLYAVTPECADGERLASLVAASLEGGASLVQYRAKSLDPAAALAQARALRALCRRYDAPFIVNDSVALALAVDADGAHLGRDDGDLASARRALGARILGVSCYDRPELARAAARAGADYVALGSVFASPTKPGAVRLPLERLREARAASGLPVAAIGGITPANAAEAVAAGADMLAVISALFDAADVRRAARELAAPCIASATSHPDHVRAQSRAV